MGLAEVLCLLHNPEETRVYYVQTILELSEEGKKRKLFTA
jgi:hypothetical protein